MEIFSILKRQVTKGSNGLTLIETYRFWWKVRPILGLISSETKCERYKMISFAEGKTSIRSNYVCRMWMGHLKMSKTEVNFAYVPYHI